MSKQTPLIPIVTPEKLKVWVLAPYLVTHDENIDYYYDFSQSIAEYSKTFDEMKIEWKWQPVTMANYVEVINSIQVMK